MVLLEIRSGASTCMKLLQAFWLHFNVASHAHYSLLKNTTLTHENSLVLLPEQERISIIAWIDERRCRDSFCQINLRSVSMRKPHLVGFPYYDLRLAGWLRGIQTPLWAVYPGFESRFSYKMPSCCFTGRVIHQRVVASLGRMLNGVPIRRY